MIIAPQTVRVAQEVAREGETFSTVHHGARAALTENLEGNEEQSPVELIVGRRDVDDDEIAILIVADIGGGKIEIPGSIRTEVLKALTWMGSVSSDRRRRK